MLTQTFLGPVLFGLLGFQGLLGWRKCLLCGDASGGEDAQAHVAETFRRALAAGAVADDGLLRTVLTASSVLTPQELEEGVAASLSDKSRLQEVLGHVGSSGSGAAEQDDGPEDMAALLKLKVADLKARLSGMELSTCGLKKELAERLLGALQKSSATATQGNRSLAARSPVVLVLDESLQQLPWEGMDFLRGCSVSRAPSLDFVLARGSSGEAEYSLRSGYFVLDPESNLPRTQAALKNIFVAKEKEWGWEGLVGMAPLEAELR